MDKILEKHLAEVFEQDYRGYGYFVKNVINKVFTDDDTFEALPVPEDILDETNRSAAANAGILKILKIGRIDSAESIDIYDITLRDNKQLQYNRVGIQQLIRSQQIFYSNAFLLFHNEHPEGKEWRFSFFYKQGKNKDTSSAKRFTYLFGKNYRARTASERFARLAEMEKDTDNLLEAFSVEALSKDFFNEYKNQYNQFCKFLFEHKADTAYFGREFSQWEDKRLRDYVKKMMGRITFIYFLQRKGWMNGDYEYMQNAFKQSTLQDNYLDAFLEPLFFGVLNTKPEERRTLFEEKKWDLSLLDEWESVPYLNGGLFERDKQDEPKSKFPAEMFKELFDFYSRYNFTIDENDPEDAEVGVDPEMLGHIFENLLEDNKDKGAFYTPKEIVQYMCRQSIIQYLKTHEPAEQYAEPIEQLINDGIVMPILQTKSVAGRFTQLLREVKVCDPAIGSGAFPMGILYVLYHTIHYLQSHVEPHGNFDSIQTKRNIIQNNIFGVDIEQGAVDIARLRFWLALVVDANEPQPLPNLDYKITCGNSQVYRYSLDIPIADVFEEYNQVGKEKAKKANTTWNKFTLDDYKKLVIDYTEEHNDKTGLKAKISDIKNCFKTTLAKGDIRKRQLAEQKVNDYEAVPLFGKRRAEEDPIGYAAAKNVLAKLREKEHEILYNKKYENSFEWRFEYPQLLDDKGAFVGFDIIIANPPYIKEGRMSKTFFEPYKDSPYYKGKMDIWYLFASNGLDLLNSNGILCFIATNNWVTSFGASKLRDKVIQETRICNIVDFGAVMMFESASIQTMIMMFQKDKVTDDYTFDYRKLTAYKATEKEAIAVLEPSSYKSYSKAECYAPTIRRANFYGKNITFSQSDDILDKIHNIKNKIFLLENELTNGIHPHYDFINKKLSKKYKYSIGEGIFGLSKSEVKALNMTEGEAKFIKPYYNSSDNVTRYVIGCTDLSIIYTPSTFKDPRSMDSYPHLKAHLDRFKDVISSDNKPYGLHRARVESFFVGEKIVALRKCAGKPVFAYADGEHYMSATFYVIKTGRVNMKYLTGLLNSKLIEFWLKNKGKMQGANYQLDKEPLQHIPIAVPSKDIQEMIGKLVDIIILLSNTKYRASNLVQNSYISSEFETLIDGCVYEIYFPQEMQDIPVIPTLRNYVGHFNNINISDIWELYKKIDSTGIIDSINSLSLSKSEILRTIILS